MDREIFKCYDGFKSNKIKFFSVGFSGIFNFYLQLFKKSQKLYNK